MSGDDFWAPLQFWAFFAAMHPLLQPAIWIGEVLHGSPGPTVGDVMPVSCVRKGRLAFPASVPYVRLVLRVLLLLLLLVLLLV